MIGNAVPGSVKYIIADRVSSTDMTSWLSDSAVKIVNGKIADVLPASSLPSDVDETSEVLRLGNVSLMPGLVDAHCHMHCSATTDAQALALAEKDDIQRLTMRAVSAMRMAVLAGTTTVRDIGSRNEVAFPIKQAIKYGAIPGPRLLVTGTPITITAGHCWFFGSQADTADEVAKAVRNQVRQGADAIKIMSTGGMFTPTANPRLPQYPAETLAVAVREAARSGITVAAHCLSAAGVKNCVEANVHNLIHARWYSQDPSKGLEFELETAQRMSDQGQWVDPTIGHGMLGHEATDRGEAPPRAIHWSVAANNVTDEDHAETLNQMHDLGVRFTNGLDMGMPHGTHDRSAANAWAAVEKLGWDNWSALRMATIDTAEALGVDGEVGSISTGKVADLAAFGGDPAANIRDMDQASTVIQKGDVIKLRGVALV
ncbi:MAG: amidohydrolase family protein [Chloroflexi bacterium]|nr:amidohydrolase family protein [Chloroflexota bacterium]